MSAFALVHGQDVLDSLEFQQDRPLNDNVDLANAIDAQVLVQECKRDPRAKLRPRAGAPSRGIDCERFPVGPDLYQKP